MHRTNVLCSLCLCATKTKSKTASEGLLMLALTLLASCRILQLLPQLPLCLSHQSGGSWTAPSLGGICCRCCFAQPCIHMAMKILRLAILMAGFKILQHTSFVAMLLPSASI